MDVSEWLGKDNTLGIDIWNKKYRHDNESFDDWLDRVSDFTDGSPRFASLDGGVDKEFLSKEIRRLILQKKFLFGGRILANRGLNKEGVKATYSNCFSGNTEIRTRQGIVEMKDVVDEDIEVFSFGAWRPATVRYFGEQRMFTLNVKKLNSTASYSVTPNHIWYAKKKSDSTFQEYTTEELEPGMILREDYTKAYRSYKPSPFGVAHGLFYGDGEHTGVCRRMNLCGDKAELLPYFMPDTVGSSGDTITICSIPKIFWGKPSLDETPSYLYGWLSGYFAADGSIDTHGNCVICSSKKSDLEFVQDVLCVLGMPIYEIREQVRESNLTHEVSTIYILRLNRKYFNENFFVRSKHKERFLANGNKSRDNPWVVDSIEVSSSVEPVYCVVEEERHSFTLKNGILTHNCYCLAVKDSIQDIYEVAKNTALTYKAGGGVGIDISNLAPAGARVNNPAKTSSGAVSFIELFTTTTGLIGINGRRSALMVSMACDHPDIGEFIDLKTDVDKATTANLSVRVSDEFMNIARDDRINDWNCKFYRMETDELISRHYDAKKLFRKLCDANYDYGEPGILFWDKIKSYSIVSDYPNFKFAGVNPCVRGDTLILTDKGWKEIQSLVGTTVNVWNGQEWSEVNPRITGFNQKMLKITTSDGCSVDCTHYHKFHLADGSVIPANKLRIGDKLVKCSFPNIHESKVEFDPLMYTYGAFQGDGSRDYVRGKAFLYLYGDKKKLAEYCTDIVRYSYGDTRDDYKLINCPAEVFSKTFIPMDGTLSQKLSWLAGYIDTDGCRNSADGSVSISSIDKDMLMKVKLMLNTIGCTGSINVMKEKGLRPMPDGKGGYADFECQRSYRLVISARNVEKLLALGLTLHRVEVAPHTNRDAQRFITITGIEDTEDADIVYCMTEPKAHRFIANGMIVGNCAETALPDGGACLLGSMNLSAYVVDGKFDMNAFGRDVSTAIRALNLVQMEGEDHHPLEKQKETARNWRQIGLGIMGLGDMLIKMNMVYGSYESITLCDEIADTMAKSAIHESVVLGHKIGSFGMFNEDNTNKSEFIRNHADKRITALRNAQLLSIAPTGSISTMLGVSGGIEPLYALEYTRTTKSLQGREETYSVCPEVVQNARKEGRTGCLVCAKDIPYANRIRMQAVWQKHVDASISSTINLPEDFNREEIWDIYFSAWEAGLKGITVFRDGCKRAGILNTKKEEPTQVIDVKSEELVGKKRKLMTGCGSLHVTAFFDKNTGDLRETFLSHGSTGGCNNFMIGLSRMVSLSARAGCSIDAIVDQLKSCGSCPSYAVRRATKGDTSLGSCCPSAVGNALIEMHEEMLRELDEGVAPPTPPKEDKTIVNPCPVCGAELHFTNGCMSCTCGFSKCG